MATADLGGSLLALYDLIFRELVESRERLRRTHDELEIRVMERTADLKILNMKMRAEVNERKQAEYSLYKSKSMLCYKHQ